MFSFLFARLLHMHSGTGARELETTLGPTLGHMFSTCSHGHARGAAAATAGPARRSRADPSGPDATGRHTQAAPTAWSRRRRRDDRSCSTERKHDGRRRADRRRRVDMTAAAAGRWRRKRHRGVDEAATMGARHWAPFCGGRRGQDESASAKGGGGDHDGRG